MPLNNSSKYKIMKDYLINGYTQVLEQETLVIKFGSRWSLGYGAVFLHRHFLCNIRNDELSKLVHDEKVLELCHT